MFYEFWIYKSEINKKCVIEKMFQNDFLSFGFSISEISFTYGIIILETLKTVKGNFGIFKNVWVQEEKCRGAGRNILSKLT